jgi:hypothetical protein
MAPCAPTCTADFRFCDPLQLCAVFDRTCEFSFCLPFAFRFASLAPCSFLPVPVAVQFGRVPCSSLVCACFSAWISASRYDCWCRRSRVARFNVPLCAKGGLLSIQESAYFWLSLSKRSNMHCSTR